MDAGTRSKFTQFLRSRGCDALNNELLANEMQAFLMHTPDRHMFSAAALGMSEAELQTLRDSFQAGLFPRPPAVAAQPYQFE
ncbi:hypothetical protein EDC30_10739 [Paucimonas lemoignei]|uniref:Uncharacterized protein n=1 Tax=Paucimonas lemoignei TaxID=29443 RepID=A0A4R3HT62_PAULE|nr:hypothetical protein [Paucimonas lemoignei]TCS36222.1 hypothetical protein EDC30_10739 [Paucimonas lemoignei]